ncbi:MAG TPA: polysaccharide biosynthesis tyrosine autokinase [Thermoanaerobaculia bacterium]|nr:polysaccharide biosynthesis tyrosine autokinase [Thermoanaerobaculia bacterium]
MVSDRPGGIGLSTMFGELERDTPLADQWSVIVKGRKLIIICVAVGLLSALLMSLFAEAKYKAVVVLNVERDIGRLFEVGTEQAYAPSDPNFLATQTRLMRSREVAERVVTRLNLLGHQDINPSKSGLFRAGTPTSNESDAGDLARAAVGIQGGVTATPVPTTNLVELAYVGRSPKATADIANALAESYIDWTLESKFQVVGQASKFLTAQIETLKSEVEQKETQLHEYGLQKDIISVDPKTNVTLQKLESLNKDYSAAMSDRVTKESRFYELQASPTSSAASPTDPVVAQLNAEILKLQRAYTEKAQLYKPEFPALKELKRQTEEAQRALANAEQQSASKAREEARHEYLTAQRREQSLKEALELQKREAMQLNSNAVEFNNLRNEVETKRNLLDTLQKRQAETEVTARLRGQRVSTIRIVDRALVPYQPFSPSYPRNLWQGFLYGALAGVALAFMRDFLDRSLRTVEQVERFIRLPALGVIPAVGAIPAGSRKWYGYGYGSSRRKKDKRVETGDKAKIELVPHLMPRSAVAEAYRAVRAALLLSQAGGVKSMVVTSCLPGEGKTSTALNLACVLGQLEKKVLLVDADLHKPRIHEALHLSNRVGLVSVLVENVSPTRAILPTSVPGVYVVLSGPTPPNPSGLLSSDAMRRFHEFVVMNFDYVVFDSPPVESVADALILGSQTDGIVVCVEGGSTPRERVVRLRNRIAQSNVNIIGVLINKFQEEAMGYGKYYRYYKAHGYGSDRAVQTEPPAAAQG